MTMNEKPNVIFILSDDQGPWAAGCYGNSEIRTPNIDALAERGQRFTNFFCTSPVCSPSRASLLTGKIPSQHGVHDWLIHHQMPPDPIPYLQDFVCYTDILAKNGYVCGLSGKWHLGDSLTPQNGFSHWFCHQGGSGPYRNANMVRNGESVVIPEYLTDVITDDAIGFIEQNRDRPFYASVHYTAPHFPWTGHPQDIVDSYDDCPFDSCPQEPAHPWGGHLTQQYLGDREALKGYFAAVTAMDANIGRIVQRVEELGLRENTLIMFTSDNGFSCGHHGFWGKGNGTFPINMYENSVKVPMIISHPTGIAEGKTVKAMMSQYDVMPTLLDYLGLDYPMDPSFPGVSFVPVLEGSREEAREDVVVYDEYGPVRMIRTHEWKYIHRFPYGAHELYDMVNDPDERHNLIEEESRASLVKELRGRLLSWFDTYVDTRYDGSNLPVSGSGQKDKIERTQNGYECFYTDRLVINEKGGAEVKIPYRMDYEKNYS